MLGKKKNRRNKPELFQNLWYIQYNILCSNYSPCLSSDSSNAIAEEEIVAADDEESDSNNNLPKGINRLSCR